MSKIKKCPNCQSGLVISEFSCPECSTSIKGSFTIEESSSMFDRFTDEEGYFILVFLQCSGVIQDVEKIMGISYPTVKAKLKDIQRKLEGNHFHERQEDFDKDEFKREMREFKTRFKEKIKSEIRSGMHHGFKNSFVMHMHDEDDECCQEHSEPSEKVNEPSVESQPVKDILDKLERGEINFDQALSEIKSKKQ